MLLGALIGIVLTVGGYYFSRMVLSYLAAHPALSPISSMLERPLDKYTILRLSGRRFGGSEIILDEVTATTSAYTVYRFHYISDGSKVTGVAHIPNNASITNKKPVIIQFRGFIDPSQYFPGDGTQHSAEVYAQNGFISLAPDFLGFGGSDKPSKDVFEERFQTYTTGLNLIASVGTLPMADASKIGIWGHSNGGHIALTVAEILNKPWPMVLWAPVSSSFPYSILYYSDEEDDHGKLLRKELATFENSYDVERYSVPNYLNRIIGPVQVHQGLADDAVPVGWSDALVATLKRNGTSVSYFTYPGVNHDMNPAVTGWNIVVSRDVTFFKKYLE